MPLSKNYKNTLTSGQSQPYHALNSIHITICYILQGGLQRQIEAISNEKTIQLLNATVESPVMEFLPSIVRDFSLISNNEGFEDNLETGYIKEHCAKWLDNIHEILTKVPFKYYVSIFLAFFHPTHPPCNWT